jgi:hypothetical protein
MSDATSAQGHRPAAIGHQITHRAPDRRRFEVIATLHGTRSRPRSSRGRARTRLGVCDATRRCGWRRDCKPVLSLRLLRHLGRREYSSRLAHQFRRKAIHMPLRGRAMKPEPRSNGPGARVAHGVYWAALGLIVGLGVRAAVAHACSCVEPTWTLTRTAVTSASGMVSHEAYWPETAELSGYEEYFWFSNYPREPGRVRRFTCDESEQP